MIYIDPPYNTGNEFVYNDDFCQSQEDYAQEAGEIDEVSGARLVSKAFTLNANTSPRYHSKWCSMMYSRLLLSRDLLRRDGVIFISIDDHEQHHLRDICDEIFGERNFVAQFVWKKKQGGANDTGAVVIDHEYILLYAKDLDSADLGLDYEATPDSEGYPFEDDKGRYNLITLDKSSIRKSASLIFEIEGPNGEIYRPRVVKGVQSCWRWSKEKVLQDYDQLVFKDGKVYTKNYMKAGVKPRSLLIEANRFGRTNHGKKDLQHLFETCPFSYPKPVALVKYLLSLINGRDFTVLDFFSGSATTAHAVMQLNAEDGGNRKFIMVQLPEETDEKSEAYKNGYKNICEIGKERIRRAGDKIVQETGKTDLDIGFRVLKVDDSNMQDVYYKPSELKQVDLLSSIDNIKADRTPLDLLFGVMVEWGVSLSLPLQEVKVGNNTIHIVGDNDLVACFDRNVSTATITKMAELNPTCVVFRDSCFEKDDEKINMFEIFKTICHWDDKQAKDNVRVM